MLANEPFRTPENAKEVTLHDEKLESGKNSLRELLSKYNDRPDGRELRQSLGDLHLNLGKILNDEVQSAQKFLTMDPQGREKLLQLLQPEGQTAVPPHLAELLRQHEAGKFSLADAKLLAHELKQRISESPDSLLKVAQVLRDSKVLTDLLNTCIEKVTDVARTLNNYDRRVPEQRERAADPTVDFAGAPKDKTERQIPGADVIFHEKQKVLVSETDIFRDTGNSVLEGLSETLKKIGEDRIRAKVEDDKKQADEDEGLRRRSEIRTAHREAPAHLRLEDYLPESDAPSSINRVGQRDRLENFERGIKEEAAIRAYLEKAKN